MATARPEYEAWVAADRRFQELLVGQFGNAAGDRRYDATQRGWSDETKEAAREFVRLGGIARKAMGWVTT